MGARWIDAPELLIFDCDGVLVDSEPLAMAVLLEGLAEAGLALPPEHAYERFLGRDLASVTTLLKQEFDLDLDPPALKRMRERLYESFARELRPMSGIAAALGEIDLPSCVASSSPVDRVRFSLDLADLRSHFEPNIFSATMVANGKPAPDLFLHAARSMGVDPARCVVVEDSPSGVEAAQRAGMTVLAFTGGGHAKRATHRLALEAMRPTIIFDDMRQLPHHLGMVSRIGQSAR